MPAPFAVFRDVEARWRTLSSDEQAVATTLIADASGKIRDRWSDVDARVTSGSLDAESIKRVVAGMVKRAMLALDTAGVESRQQSAGPFVINDKFSNPMGDLYFTAADIEVFDPVASRSVVRQAWLA